MLEQDLESALAAIPSGYGEGMYEGLRYGVTVLGSLATESGPACSRERSRLQPLPAEVGRGHANVALAQRRFTFFWRASLTARRISPGFAPRRRRRRRRNRSGKFGPYAIRPPPFDVLPSRMHRRQSQGQRQGIDTNAMGIHERVDTDITPWHQLFLARLLRCMKLSALSVMVMRKCLATLRRSSKAPTARPILSAPVTAGVGARCGPGCL